MFMTNSVVNIVFRKLKTLNKKDFILNIIMLAILLTGVSTVFNNYNWYDKTIVKIESTDNSLSDESKQSNKKEKYFNQVMTGTIMNGEYQGEKAHLNNRYSSSGLLDEEYKPGDEVFVKIQSDMAKELSGSVIGLKRDKYMGILAALFIWFLFIVTKGKSFLFMISLTVNIAALSYALILNDNGHNILMISNCLVLFFTFTSLLLIGGINRKTFIAILSTLISLGFTMVLFKITMMYTEGVDYTYMEYIYGQNNLSELFLSQILIGSLGAIMDVAITEASAINELVDKNNKVSVKELIRSGREVGYDIMGTMINIMLFAYICGAVPLIILKLKNNIDLHTIIIWQIPMELYRFLIGSIGILLTIPISLFISIMIFKKGRRVLC